MAKICIDPGHYGKQNRSPGIPEYYESEMVWKLANLQKKYLELYRWPERFFRVGDEIQAIQIKPVDRGDAR